MGFVSKELQCIECGANFTFSAEDQELYAGRGYIHEPKRCPACREARKARNYQYGTGGSGSYGVRRQMYPAVCAECGAETEVPFQPRQGRPVYCSNCYNKLRLNQRR
jgi:CxxC-x17-CxxC domain-containing protein